MRRKTHSSHPAAPRKRARPVADSVADSVATPPTSPRIHHWAHAEWFQSALDEPYFSHSDFHAVVATRMVHLADVLAKRPTRLQLARIRAAMCNMLPGGFVQPRRFSPAFLLAERQELDLYRNDARRVLRGLDLLPTLDPTTADQLPQNWWSRHTCSPPVPLQRGAQVLVRTYTAPPSMEVLTQLHIQLAIFLAVEADAQTRVRFHHDASEHVVSDLDVMLYPSPSSTSDSCLPSPGLPPSHIFERSPASIPFPFSPSAFSTPIFDFSGFPDAPQSIIQLYQSPRPTLVSPRRSLEVKTQRGNSYECDIDIQRVAESMRLLDRKAKLLNSFKLLNDDVSATITPAHPPPDAVAAKYNSFLSALDNVNAEISLHIEPDRSTPYDLPPTLYITSDMGTPKLDKTPERKMSSSFSPLKDTPISLPLIKKESALGTPGYAPPPFLRPENIAKNVDFRSGPGAALLAKALTKAALSHLPADSALKASPTPVRADVMECVSACVAIIVRARTTQDYHCIEELIDGLRSRFPGNMEAINTINAAARIFETSSSESG